MSFLTKIRDGAEYPFEKGWEAIKNVFASKYQQRLKIFFELFAHDEGEEFLDKAPEFLTLLETTGFAAATAALIKEVLGDSVDIAKKDWALAAAQSALQVAKVEANAQTATDKAIITAATA